MVRIKKRLSIKKISKSQRYKIKTRNGDRRAGSMIREIKNIQEPQFLVDARSKSLPIPRGTVIPKATSRRLKRAYKRHKDRRKIKVKSKSSKNARIRIGNRKGVKTGGIDTNEHSHSHHNLGINRNGKNNKLEKKIHNEIYKYIYQETEYFELKEILGFIYEDMHIDLDKSNKIKDREEFKNRMNDMLKNYFVIYYNKILISPGNLIIFLDYLSKFVDFDAKEVIKSLNKKCKTQFIEENIVLQQFFKPTLFLSD